MESKAETKKVLSSELRCTAFAQSTDGERCKNHKTKGTEFCASHNPVKEKKSPESKEKKSPESKEKKSSKKD